MAAWRRKAVGLFPGLARDLSRADYSIYMLFFELLPMARDAHDTGDEPLLAKIYGYAEWSLRQGDKDLWNAAGVAFYEHLLEGSRRANWPIMLSWLSPFVIRECAGLWKSRGEVGGWQEMLQSSEGRLRRNYERNVYHTGEIAAI